MNAKFISGSGDEGTAALVEIDGQLYECMDCLGYGRNRRYEPGQAFQVVLSAGLVKRTEIGGNPDQLKALDRLRGWHYRAYGVVVMTASGLVLDCGAVSVQLPDPMDRALAGRFIAVEIERLDCWRARKNAG